MNAPLVSVVEAWLRDDTEARVSILDTAAKPRLLEIGTLAYDSPTGLIRLYSRDDGPLRQLRDALTAYLDRTPDGPPDAIGAIGGAP